ncbi:Lipoprotein-releasing system ATP-binding protein LolD [termite gut metagenome]|uniref:Lipoprotein-releasing system ATP-binding protein LolD n=1 Tax=termite gut metagenome TaxID=433724 RepID=A0A5J4QEM2_9ZZZZ
MIRLSGIIKTFPDGENKQNHVLRGVKMEVSKGDFVAIEGASGSGKTTLLSILGTLIQPDGGSYLLDGKEMLTAGVDHSAVRNKYIGLVFQDHRLMPQYCILDNILLPTLAYSPQTNSSQTEYARQLMDLTGIASLAYQYPQTVSGGEASRTALCRSLIMKPLLLLADEPTGQLDAENAQNIASLLTKINKELGTTIVMVTHSKETASVAQRIVMLKNGLLV